MLQTLTKSNILAFQNWLGHAKANSSRPYKRACEIIQHCCKAPSSSLSFLHYYYYSTAASTRNTAHPWRHRWARHVTSLLQARHASAHVHPAWTGPGAVEQIRPSLLQLYASVLLRSHPSQSQEITHAVGQSVSNIRPCIGVREYPYPSCCTGPNEHVTWRRLALHRSSCC
jgi:hypothetical protein